MTREAARAWLQRWRLVESREIAELRAMTPQQKFDQLVALFEFARQFPSSSSDDRAGDEAEDEVIRARWNRLRFHVRR